MANTGRTRWKPGQVTNPKGRPKLLRNIVSMARTYTEEGILELANIMRTGKNLEKIAAIKILLERGWGAPLQKIEHEAENGERLLHYIISANSLSEKEWIDKYGARNNGSNGHCLAAPEGPPEIID